MNAKTSLSCWTKTFNIFIANVVKISTCALSRENVYKICWRGQAASCATLLRASANIVQNTLAPVCHLWQIFDAMTRVHIRGADGDSWRRQRIRSFPRFGDKHLLTVVPLKRLEAKIFEKEDYQTANKEHLENNQNLAHTSFFTTTQRLSEEVHKWMFAHLLFHCICSVIHFPAQTNIHYRCYWTCVTKSVSDMAQMSNYSNSSYFVMHCIDIENLYGSDL